LQLVAVSERIQKCHDVLDVGFAQRRRSAGYSIEGRLGVEIAPVLRRQVVEFHGDPAGPAGVPFLRLRVALGIKAHDVRQAVEHPIMEVHPASRGIAQ